MDLIEDELSKIFDPIELLPHIRVKKVITDEGIKIIPLEKGDLEKAIPIVVEIEDKRNNGLIGTDDLVYRPEIYTTWTTGYIMTGYTLTTSDGTSASWSYLGTTTDGEYYNEKNY